MKGVDGAMHTLQEGDNVTKSTVLANVREGDYLQRVAGAKAQLAEASALREQSKLETDRTQKLVASGSVAQAQLDQVKAQLDAANARVDAAQAQLVEAQNAVADTALRTPIDGVVLKRGIEVGSLVAPGALGFVIADTRQVKAVFGVPDVMVEKLQIGSELAITTEAAQGREFKGRITRVSPSADLRSRVFEVEVTVPNPAAQLKAGMIASLKISEGGGRRLRSFRSARSCARRKIQTRLPCSSSTHKTSRTRKTSSSAIRSAIGSSSPAALRPAIKSWCAARR